MYCNAICPLRTNLLEVLPQLQNKIEHLVATKVAGTEEHVDLVSKKKSKKLKKKSKKLKEKRHNLGNITDIL